MKTLTADAQAPPVAPQEPAHASLLEEYLLTLRRHKLALLLCVVTATLLALAFTLRTEPIYRTQTSVDIRSINNDFITGRSVAQTDGGGGMPADNDMNLQTQIKILESDTLRQLVTERLLAAPHPASIPRGDLLSVTQRALHLGGGESIPYTTLVDETAKSVKVKPLGLTRLVEITCDSWDANFAATFCNEMSRTFEQQDQQSRAEEAKRTSTWLTQQAADIRQRAEEGQKKLEAAVGGNGLMLSQNTGSVGEERLRSLQDELVKAQSDRFAREADAGVARLADTGTAPGVESNAAYRSYEATAADLRAKLATLVPPLTEENPKVIRLRQQIAEADNGMRLAQATSNARGGNELEAARHREQLLRLTYNAQVFTVSSDLQKSAQVNLLRREVESEQQLYQTLIQRAKEAGFAAAMQAATIRVIDTARVPASPYSPRRLQGALAGAGLGLLAGFAFAFYKDRHHRVFRVPGDVQRFLHLNELGTIPTAKKLPRQRPTQPALSLAAAGAAEPTPMPSDTLRLTRWDESFSLVAEAYRSVTFSLLLASSNELGRSYVITSPNAGEGKTTITANVAVALSRSRLRVVVIDGDLRRPSLHEALHVDNSVGLRNILRGEFDLERIPVELLARSCDLPLVHVIPAGEGSGDVDEMLHSPYFSRLLTRLRQEYDVILIDTPPMLHMTDARVLASQADGVIFVVRASQTMRDDASTARDLFVNDGAHFAGSILNDFDPTAEGKGRYYDSYYRYQAAQGGGGGARQAPAE